MKPTWIRSALVVALVALTLCSCKEKPTAIRTNTPTTVSDNVSASETETAAAPQTGSSNPAPPTSKAAPSSATKTATDAAAKLPPPCSLITAAEVSASIGQSVTAVDSSADNDPDQISCSYLDSSQIPVFLLLIRDWSLARFTADAAQEPGKPQPITGIGTAAYLGSNGNGPVVLTWERGVAVVANGTISAEQVKFLAKVAVGQLDAPK